jgi:hypothetical protein
MNFLAVILFGPFALLVALYLAARAFKQQIGVIFA